MLSQGLSTMMNEGSVFKEKDAQTNLRNLQTLAKELAIGSTESIELGENFESQGNNISYILSAANQMSDVYNNFGDLAGSFGRFNLYFSFEGTINRTDENTAVITVSGVFYRIKDSFDFSGYQPLGAWKHDVYSPQAPTAFFGGNSLTNSSFRDFRDDTGVGTDYKIITNYVEVENPIATITLHLEPTANKKVDITYK